MRRTVGVGGYDDGIPGGVCANAKALINTDKNTQHRK